jgi:hypothetical protein
MWMIGVGGHQSLLDCEHQVVSGVKGGRGHWRIAPTEAEVQRVNRFAEARWRLRLILEAEGLDVIEQDVGFGEQRPPARLSGGFGQGVYGRGGHAKQHNRCDQFVKWTFTVSCLLTA